MEKKQQNSSSFTSNVAHNSGKVNNEGADKGTAYTLKGSMEEMKANLKRQKNEFKAELKRHILSQKEQIKEITARKMTETESQGNKITLGDPDTEREEA